VIVGIGGGGVAAQVEPVQLMLLLTFCPDDVACVVEPFTVVV
jgi:hypothetical protein